MRFRSALRVSLAVILALAFAAAVPAEARNRPHSWEFGVFGGEMVFDVPLLFVLGERGNAGDLLGTRTTEFFGFRLGYNFTPHWEVEFTHDDASTEDRGFKDVQRDFISDSVTVNYNFLTTTERRVYPYLTGGLGRIVSKVTVFSKSEEDDPITIILGGGFRLFFNKSISLRIDGRWKSYNETIDFPNPDPTGTIPPIDIDDRFTNFEFTIGLHGIIGGKR